MLVGIEKAGSIHIRLPQNEVRGGLVFKAHRFIVPLNSRHKGLLGPVSRAIQKKKERKAQGFGSENKVQSFEKGFRVSGFGGSTREGMHIDAASLHKKENLYCTFHVGP